MILAQALGTILITILFVGAIFLITVSVAELFRK